jgi:hypothetical protein
MTKLIQKFSFWDKIRLILLSLGIGGEITLHLAEVIPQWKVVAGIATFIALVITYFFKDENHNDIIDIAE